MGSSTTIANYLLCPARNGKVQEAWDAETSALVLWFEQEEHARAAPEETFQAKSLSFVEKPGEILGWWVSVVSK
jgi:hypothetical protein